MSELCDQNTLSQTKVVCGKKKGKPMCISAQKLLQSKDLSLHKTLVGII